MAMQRGRPGSPGVRKSRNVGPDYPEENFENPTNAGVDSLYHPDETGKTLNSLSANTIEGAQLPENGKYDDLWEGK